MNRLFRFCGFLVLGLALLGFFAFSSTAQGDNIWVAAIHSDLKGATNFIASNNGNNNTVWNAYVWGDTHPALYGSTVLSNKPVPSVAAEVAPPFVQEGALFASTVKLLHGFKWSDGTELTADDVVFSYNAFLTRLENGHSLALELGGNFPSSYDDNFLDHVEKLDAYTVKFLMKQVPGLATWEFGMLQSWLFQKAYWEPKLQSALASADPVASLSGLNTTDEPTAGPFNFVRWEPGAFAEVVGNDAYSFKGTVGREYTSGGYSEVLPDGTARSFGDTSGSVELETTTGPNVDGVLYTLFGSQAAAALAVINGDSDYHLNPLGYGKATLDQLESASNVRVLKNSADSAYYMAFNMRKSPFNYLEFRQAVRCVIDKEFVADQLLSGLVIPAPSLVPVGNQLFHDGLDGADAQVACVGMSEEERLAKARGLLEGAGFKFDGGQLVADPEGSAIPQLELLHPNAAYDNNRNIFGLHIVDRMNKLGIPVRDVPAGFNNIVTLVFSEQDFDMWQLGWTLSFFPQYLEADFHSRHAAAPDNAAQGGICSSRENALNGCQEAFDVLADAFLSEQDLDKAVSIAKEMQQLIFDNVAYIPTHYTTQFDAYRVDRVDWQGLEDQAILDGIQSVNGNTGARNVVRVSTR